MFPKAKNNLSSRFIYYWVIINKVHYNPKHKIHFYEPIHIYINYSINKRREETNLQCRGIPNNFCRYCSIKEVKFNSSQPECGLHLLTCFQVCKGLGVKLQWRNLTNTRLSNLTSSLTSNADSMCP